MQANLKINELRIREYGKVAVLMGGLLMAGIYEIRRRQQKAAA